MHLGHKHCLPCVVCCFVITFCGALQVLIHNSTLAQNSAWSAGGIYMAPGTNLTMSHSNLTANQAATSGAAMFMSAQSLAAVRSCMFSSNNATNGGAISCEGCKLRLDRAMFANNAVVDYGGGLEAMHAAHVRSGHRSCVLVTLQQPTKEHTHAPSVACSLSCSLSCSRASSAGVSGGGGVILPPYIAYTCQHKQLISEMSTPMLHLLDIYFVFS